jgi:hypothetical protein
LIPASSATVGTSGMPAARCADDTASTLMLPERISGSAAG